jgi:PAS domain S-box-containing protein
VKQYKGKGMKKRKPDRSHAEELRRKAEERLQLENPLPEEISPAEAQKLIHELRVHQIELEMQNDELRQAQEILEESRSRYSDLYDFAPIGYLTLDELGIIREANLTAARQLAVERSRLIDRQLTHFMVTEDRGAFRRHLNLVLKGRERQTCELRLKRKDGSEFFTLLESAFYQDTAGRSLCRTAFTDITARRQAEVDLKESEERYRSLFKNNHAVMLLIDPATGNIVDANPAASAFYGYPHEELISRKITDINMLPKDQVFKEMQRAGSEQRRQFFFRHRLARGEVRDVEVFSGPIRLKGQDLLYSIIHDITARKQAEEALQRQKEELQIILDSVPAMIFYKDKENRFIQTNKALAEATGLPKEEIDGKSIFDLYPSKADDYWKDDQEVIRSGNPKRNIVETMETPEGVRWVQTDKIPYRDAQGNIIGIIGFSVDITERKWAETALQASKRFLEIANHHSRMTPLLEASVAEVKSLTGCEAVGIRVLQENGYIPYVFYDGFKQEFYDLENHISIWFDRCACINIVKGDVDPNLPFYTPGGSFYINRLDEFFCRLSPEERGMFRGNCHKFGYESMALVPIRLGRQILGMIHAADPHKDIIPLAMVELLEKVGMQLGMAIQRVRANEALRRAHSDMERLVKERTAELKLTVEALQEEITERLQAEEDLKVSEQRLRYLTSQLLTAQERERKRISLELHDDLGQSLIVLKMQMRAVERNLPPELRDAKDGCSTALDYLVDIINNIRRISQNLRPSILEEMGLSKALMILVDEFCKMQEVECARDMDDISNSFPAEAEIVIYRIFQETLTNIAKHAQATKIEMAIKKYDHHIHFSLKDNGTGFDVEHVSAGSATARGMGLGSMEERVRMLDGTLQLWSEEGKGTKISFILPININKPN